MAQAVAVLRERSRTDGRRCPLLADVPGQRQVLVAGCVRDVARPRWRGRRDVVADRRHDRVDDPFSGVTPPGTASGSYEGTGADHARSRRADDHVPAPVAHIGLAFC
jgi:hypothetical protein